MDICKRNENRAGVCIFPDLRYPLLPETPWKELHRALELPCSELRLIRVDYVADGYIFLLCRPRSLTALPPENYTTKKTREKNAENEAKKAIRQRVAKAELECQRRLNFDPLCFVNAKVNLTHPSNSF